MSSQETSSAGSSKPPRRPSIWDVYLPRTQSGHLDSIYIASFPDIAYFWPSILTFFFCAFLQGVAGADSVGLGWFALFVFSFNILVLVQEFDQKKFIILILTILVLALAVWIINLYGFSFIKTFVHWLLSFQPSISTDAYLVLASVMTFFFIWGMLMPMFDYWQLEQNEFVHYIRPVGRDMSIARLGCSIHKEIPDVFEYLLLWGGGQLVIKRDNEVVATIRNVPFLHSKMKGIDHMLSETKVTVSN